MSRRFLIVELLAIGNLTEISYKSAFHISVTMETPRVCKIIRKSALQISITMETRRVSKIVLFINVGYDGWSESK